MVKTFLQQFLGKFQDEMGLSAFAVWVVGRKVLDQEVNMYTKRGLSWSEFHVTSKTRTQGEVYLKGQMDKYIKGEGVNKRQK